MSTTEPQSYTPTLPPTATLHTTSTLHISLTPFPLSPSTLTTFVHSPHAGATVLFIGSTRSTFASRPVASLSYTSYIPLALATLVRIGEAMVAKHGLIKLAIEHRLGECKVGVESVVIAVSAPHRGAAWRAGEECLEEVKSKAEIWKLERFEGGEGVWRSNRDGGVGVRVEEGEKEEKEGEGEVGGETGKIEGGSGKGGEGEKV
ncbi:Molybdopterin biosynthesis MoaE [Dothidotthia symphoricarpi CBS 119687]|uniref:Molybdopterin biosynthesis MoaE n=1 Tax=Dothidotthia symphoricarpi CBS 119687 TaxID=1392245 RepID=A0A6A6AJY5_9PLEO|nr:Molybdopterin biosynthesis MoaE [Dothidotthia symphoricarpi CBS 119687]KAF2132269.1 Molybdopterin biosynthesis MoaE [Dothidotthia symphoricarpi CBS 119687]